MPNSTGKLSSAGSRRSQKAKVSPNDEMVKNNLGNIFRSTLSYRIESSLFPVIILKDEVQSASGSDYRMTNVLVTSCVGVSNQSGNDVRNSSAGRVGERDRGSSFSVIYANDLLQQMILRSKNGILNKTNEKGELVLRNVPFHHYFSCTHSGKIARASAGRKANTPEISIRGISSTKSSLKNTTTNNNNNNINSNNNNNNNTSANTNRGKDRPDSSYQNRIQGDSLSNYSDLSLNRYSTEQEYAFLNSLFIDGSECSCRIYSKLNQTYYDAYAICMNYIKIPENKMEGNSAEYRNHSAAHKNASPLLAIFLLNEINPLEEEIEEVAVEKQFESEVHSNIDNTTINTAITFPTPTTTTTTATTTTITNAIDTTANINNNIIKVEDVYSSGDDVDDHSFSKLSAGLPQRQNNLPKQSADKGKAGKKKANIMNRSRRLDGPKTRINDHSFGEIGLHNPSGLANSTNGISYKQNNRFNNHGAGFSRELQKNDSMGSKYTRTRARDIESGIGEDSSLAQQGRNDGVAQPEAKSLVTFDSLTETTSLGADRNVHFADTPKAHHHFQNFETFGYEQTSSIFESSTTINTSPANVLRTSVSLSQLKSEQVQTGAGDTAQKGMNTSSSSLPPPGVLSAQITPQRGHVVDNVTSTRLQKMLTSIQSVVMVEMSKKIPKSFFMNVLSFIMIIQEVLKHQRANGHRSMICFVYVQSTFLTAELIPKSIVDQSGLPIKEYRKNLEKRRREDPAHVRWSTHGEASNSAVTSPDGAITNAFRSSPSAINIPSPNRQLRLISEAAELQQQVVMQETPYLDEYVFGDRGTKSTTSYSSPTHNTANSPANVNPRAGATKVKSGTNEVSPKNGEREQNIQLILPHSMVLHLRSCDGSARSFSTGVVLVTFPYITEERLELLRGLSTVQLSTFKGLSLFGVSTANALTEEAATAAQSPSPSIIPLVGYDLAASKFKDIMNRLNSSQSKNNYMITNNTSLPNSHSDSDLSKAPREDPEVKVPSREALGAKTESSNPTEAENSKKKKNESETEDKKAFAAPHTWDLEAGGDDLTSALKASVERDKFSINNFPYLRILPNDDALVNFSPTQTTNSRMNAEKFHLPCTSPESVNSQSLPVSASEDSAKVVGTTGYESRKKQWERKRNKLSNKEKIVNTQKSSPDKANASENEVFSPLKVNSDSSVVSDSSVSLSNSTGAAALANMPASTTQMRSNYGLPAVLPSPDRGDKKDEAKEMEQQGTSARNAVKNKKEKKNDRKNAPKMDSLGKSDDSNNRSSPQSSHHGAHQTHKENINNSVLAKNMPQISRKSTIFDPNDSINDNLGSSMMQNLYSTCLDNVLGGDQSYLGTMYKRHLHIFLYVEQERHDVAEILGNFGHSTTFATNPTVMQRYLKVGMSAFDAFLVEWNSKLITPELHRIITKRSVVETVLLFFYKDGCDFPLPHGIPEDSIIRAPDIGDTISNKINEEQLRRYIRHQRLLRDMVEVRMRKSYQIVRQIGSGGFGDVFEVMIYVSRGRLAMKRVFLNSVSGRVLEQLNREVLIMDLLDHPNIIAFSHSLMEDNAYCIFMELCDGTLSQRLLTPSVATQWARRDGETASAAIQRTSLHPRATIQNTLSTSNGDGAQISPREAVLLMHDIASGLAYLHSKGIVHRDIKPDNILFSNGVAKIGDFGSAAKERELRPLTNMKGTLAYMSPEVLVGEPYGRPCDMWSFGCLLADVIGLRLGHLQGLHVPALIELYRSIPLDGSLPITISNYSGGGFENHYTATTTNIILEAMKSASETALKERSEYSSSTIASRPTTDIHYHHSPLGSNVNFNPLLATPVIQTTANTDITSDDPDNNVTTTSNSNNNEDDANSNNNNNNNNNENNNNNNNQPTPTSTRTPVQSLLSDTRISSHDTHPLPASESSRLRAVTCISTNSTCVLNCHTAALPVSLVELLEGLFHRDPKKRMSIEEVLDHPVTWDVEWMAMVLHSIRELTSQLEEFTANQTYHNNNNNKMNNNINSNNNNKRMMSTAGDGTGGIIQGPLGENNLLKRNVAEDPLDLSLESV